MEYRRKTVSLIKIGDHNPFSRKLSGPPFSDIIIHQEAGVQGGTCRCELNRNISINKYHTRTALLTIDRALPISEVPLNFHVIGKENTEQRGLGGCLRDDIAGD